MPKAVHLLVDGNAFFHGCKSEGLTQDFSALERGVAASLGVAKVASKTFYTRPPLLDDGKRVVGWLKAHGWVTHLYAYDYTTQDSLYVAMTSDLHTEIGSDAETSVVILSGSGSLVYPLSQYTGEVTLVATAKSLNRHLAALAQQRNIQVLPLGSVLLLGTATVQ